MTDASVMPVFGGANDYSINDIKRNIAVNRLPRTFCTIQEKEASKKDSNDVNGQRH